MFILILIINFNCSDECTSYETVIKYEYQDFPPTAPKGVYSITHDGYIEIRWIANDDYDLAGYNVYYSHQPEGPYELIAFTKDNFYYDYDVTNGQTYYYAVSAIDDDGNESELSQELVFDTPRPEGKNVTLYNYLIYSNNNGFIFATGTTASLNSFNCDIKYSALYLDELEKYYYFIQTCNENTNIQDFGYTESLDNVDYAPINGWSNLNEVEAIIGHSYIIWTADNHFAKIRINSITKDYIIFDWAYQIDTGNPELTPPNKTKHQNKYEQHTITK